MPERHPHPRQVRFWCRTLGFAPCIVAGTAWGGRALLLALAVLVLGGWEGLASGLVWDEERAASSGSNPAGDQ